MCVSAHSPPLLRRFLQLSTSVCLSTDASLLASVDIGGPCPTIVQGIENLSNGGTAPAQSCTAECKATINKVCARLWRCFCDHHVQTCV